MVIKVLYNDTSVTRNVEISLTSFIKWIKLVFESCPASHLIVFLSLMVKTLVGRQKKQPKAKEKKTSRRVLNERAHCEQSTWLNNCFWFVFYNYIWSDLKIKALCFKLLGLFVLYISALTCFSLCPLPSSHLQLPLTEICRSNPSLMLLWTTK